MSDGKYRLAANTKIIKLAQNTKNTDHIHLWFYECNTQLNDK